MTVGLLPFLPEFRRVVLEGRKTMTARPKPYGVAGDVLVTPWGFSVVLVQVREVPLGAVAEVHWDREGCLSPRDFVDCWVRCYPDEPWDPRRLVWLHEFRLASPLEPARRQVVEDVGATR